MPRTRTLLAVGAALACLASLWALWLLGLRGDRGAASGVGSRSEPAEPHLEGRAQVPRTAADPAGAPGASPGAAAPPLVYAQLEGPPPEPPVAFRVHVTLPWGALGPRPLGANSAGAYATLDRAEWSMPVPIADEEGEERSGSSDRHGEIHLEREAFADWGHRALVVSADGCHKQVFPAPPQPLPAVLEVRLVPREPLTHFRGRVLDEEGRGLPGAGVFLEAWGEPPGVRTLAEGAFDLALPPGFGGLPGPGSDERVSLVAVAPGRLAARVECAGQGEDGLEVRLLPDTTHGRLELDLVTAEGAPAAGARAWLFAVGPTFQAALGWEGGARHERATGPEADTRRFLPRLVGGLPIDEQGYEIGQDAGPFLEDLVADEHGRLLLPALLPGRYHLRAARADRTDAGREEPETGTLHVRGTLDTLLDVEPPPASTHLTLRLEPGRTVVGRVDVAANPAWHCEHRTGHHHWLRVDDWVWGEVAIESGDSLEEGVATQRSGRFRLDGVPRTACTLRLWTFGHPEVRIDLPEAPVGASGAHDLGPIVVPDARRIEVRLLRADGSEPDPAHWLWEARLEGFPGVEGAGSWSSDGRFTFVAPSPPPAGAAIVVTAREGGRRLTRVPVPSALDPEHPLEIRVPDLPPEPAPEGEAEPAAGSK